MMTRPILVAAVWAVQRTFVSAFTPTTQQSGRCMRLFSTTQEGLETCLSRLSTLQTMLNKHGAPGSENCRAANDLQPVSQGFDDLSDLHPYLYPIAQSAASPDAFVCAYRNPSTEESDKSFPWPIVETKLGGPGFKLLALNSEHLMRRIACESDEDAIGGETTELVALYNEGLGEGKVADPLLDATYQVGSVASLGYGVDKYCLLRVGPFPDLYQAMAEQHQAKGDEQSSLIAAEASNKKLSGFGSTFLYYAKLLATFPNRREESRDAARMCIRLPLATTGLSYDDLKDVAVLGEIAQPEDDLDVALEKLTEFIAKVQEAEKDDEQGDQGKTPEQAAFEEASLIIDEAVLSRKPFGSIRGEVSEKLRSVKRNEFADFVDTVV